MPAGTTDDSQSECALHESVAKYQLVMEASNDALLFVHENGRIIDANHAAERMYGWSRAELLSMAITDLRAPETHDLVRGQMQQALSGITFETLHLRKDSSRLAVEVSSRGASLSGTPILLSLVRDITLRKRREKLLELLREIDHVLRRDDSLDASLTHVCVALAEVLDLPLVWVGIKAADGSVHVMARGGSSGQTADSLGVRWDSSIEGTGPTGRALRTGQTQRVRMDTNDLHPSWRPFVSELGLRESLVAPIIGRDEVLGTISLYSSHDHRFDRETVDLVEHFADQLGLLLVEAREREQIRLQMAALDAAANAIVITDLWGQITWANPAFTQLTGYVLDEVLGKNPRFLKSSLTQASLYADLWSTITAGGVWSGELLNRRKDGTIYVDQQTITPVRTSSGMITHFIAIKVDGTDRRRQEDHLRFLAHHDPLTGLLNRRGFIEMVKQDVSGDRTITMNALLMIDLDNFKTLNDTLGHASGDAALVTVAEVIRKLLRQSDCAARYGGDEFAVLVRNVNEDEAIAVAQRIRGSLQTTHIGQDEQRIMLSASIGLAMVAELSMPEHILSLADEALAKAKSLGKNQVGVFRPETPYERRARNVWPTRIKSALARDGLVLHFQPIVRLSDGGVEYREALLRMKDGRQGLLYPGEFLPHAGRYGLAPHLDLWVIRSVLRTMARTPGLRVSANLSVQTLQDHTTLAAIERAVSDLRPGPGELMLEIAETTAVRDLQRMNDWIHRMKRLGCRFALDDFGTGASSFEHLRSLAVDVAKIDGSYVGQMLTDPSCLAFVQAISSVCSSKDVEIVAECVESAAVVELLKRIGVRLGQGFLWGRPAPLDNLQG